MRKIHAILAIHQRLYCDLLASLLSQAYDAHVITHAPDEIATAMSLCKLLDEGDFPVDDRVLVITSIGDTDDIPGSIARLLGEFPEVTFVGICWATARVRLFQLRIDVHEIPCSRDGLIEAIQECVRRPLPW